jgi:hypothetical protein
MTQGKSKKGIERIKRSMNRKKSFMNKSTAKTYHNILSSTMMMGIFIQ